MRLKSKKPNQLFDVIKTLDLTCNSCSSAVVIFDSNNLMNSFHCHMAFGIVTFLLTPFDFITFQLFPLLTSKS